MHREPEMLKYSPTPPTTFRKRFIDTAVTALAVCYSNKQGILLLFMSDVTIICSYTISFINQLSWADNLQYLFSNWKLFLYFKYKEVS